jgi:hypothetical protein
MNGEHHEHHEHHEPGADLFATCVRHGCDDLDLLLDFAGAMGADWRLDAATVHRAALAAWAHPGAAIA